MFGRGHEQVRGLEAPLAAVQRTAPRMARLKQRPVRRLLQWSRHEIAGLTLSSEGRKERREQSRIYLGGKTQQDMVMDRAGMQSTRAANL